MRPEPPHEENDEMTTDELTDIDDLRAEIDRLDS